MYNAIRRLMPHTLLDLCDTVQKCPHLVDAFAVPFFFLPSRFSVCMHNQIFYDAVMRSVCVRDVRSSMF